MTAPDYDWQEALAFDRQHIWHPYTSMLDPLPCFPVRSAQGVYIELATGERLIDGMASWWSAIHGYCHPYIDACLQAQAKDMSHVMFGGLSHRPAIELARKLVDMTPAALDKVFLADSGSVAIEVAIKMAMQYWYASGKPGKNKVLSLKGAYHGDTTGCMSVCDPEGGMHEMFSGILPKQMFVSRPACRFGDSDAEADIAELREILAKHHDGLAAMIVEPIVQGAGGMYFYSAAYLKAARELCDEYQLLLIADEIATGFGRAGKLFACEYAGITPDIMSVGKALTGGYMTLAATLATSKVATTISSYASGSLMHGPTFMANPLACACANASLELLQSNDWQTQVNGIDTLLRENFGKFSQLEHVEDVRVLGAIGVIELVKPVNMAKIQQAFVKAGVWVRPFGKLVYIMPPYIIGKDELTQLCEAMFAVLADADNIF